MVGTGSGSGDGVSLIEPSLSFRDVGWPDGLALDGGASAAFRGPLRGHKLRPVESYRCLTMVPLEV